MFASHSQVSWLSGDVKVVDGVLGTGQKEARKLYTATTPDLESSIVLCFLPQVPP